MRNFLLAFFLSFVLASIVSGQESETVRTEFRVIPVLSADWNGVLYRPSPGSDFVELKFQSLARSFKTYEYQGPNPIVFYREDGVDESGETLYKPVGSLSVQSSELVVFFMRNSAIGRNGSKLEFALFGLDDGPDALPMDHVSFLNLTGVQLGSRFMEENIMLEQGFNRAISLKNSLEEDIFVGMVVQNEESHRIVLKNNWRFNEGNRHIILLLPPKKAGSFRIRAYRITEFVGENSRFNSSWKHETAEL